MSYYLLLGAGFSRNWDGWLADEAFEYLLGCPEVNGNKKLQKLLWKNKNNGGFENALEEAKTNNKENYESMQAAVSRMFNDMNSGYLAREDFEFQKHHERMVGTFLTKFDAIFTLNQDLLIEYFYIGRDVTLQSNRRWSGSSLPGMKPIPNHGAENQDSWAEKTWIPKSNIDNEQNTQPQNTQPYYKLHGSSNWKDTEGGNILIIGGNKTNAIKSSKILSEYHTIFKESLSKQDAQLMIIGYGFRDNHINDIIKNAINNYSIKIFVIAPDGGTVARQNIGEEVEHALVGASRRPLSTTFGTDTTEYEKVIRFFNQQQTKP